MRKYEESLKKQEMQYAFIDETGNYGFDFDKEGVTTHFIITAVIVAESKVKSLEDQIESIRKRFFQTGEMKSNGIRNNHSRREKLLKQISEFDFHYYYVAIDKRLIYKDSGLMYKEPFLKYLNSRLHKELYISFPKLQMVADQQGNKEFMDGFIKYVNSRHQPNLFEEYEFGFVNSKHSVLVQLADILCGTIAFKYDQTKDNDQYYKFEKYIQEKCVGFNEWPGTFEDYLHDFKKYNKGQFDEIILVNSIRLVDDYILKFQNSGDIQYRERVLVLKYLKSMLLSKEKNTFITSDEIIQNLSFLTKQKYGKHYFKTRIIAKLRDYGVLISSSNKGYKIPECENDLYYFVNQTNSMIVPMFARLKKARDRVKVATKGKLDILDKDEYLNLRSYLDRN